MLASATGESSSVRRLSMAAAKTKRAAPMIVNAKTNPAERAAAGIARILVRGFLASYSLSATRLKAIAVERAPIIAKVIHNTCAPLGMPFAASTAPRKANGSAKSVCSILIISSVVPMLRTIVDMLADFERGLVRGTSPAAKTNHFLLALPTRGRRMRNSELIKNAKDEMIYQGFNRLRPMIEARARRQNLRAGAG